MAAAEATVMPVPRAELKLVRLLSRCEALAADRRGPDEWRLEKYVSALEEMLLDLKKHSSKPAPEVLNEYSRKVDFLKGLLEADKLSSSSEKALANQFLAPGRTPTTTKERTPATKTVHLQTKARYTGEMRNELLGTVMSHRPRLAAADPLTASPWGVAWARCFLHLGSGSLCGHLLLCGVSPNGIFCL
ncbi:USE1-like protein [Podarcis lilfordi]|uniref:Vesicle transport protein USE1 n=1 Tax=Podarcis lilfordi TaxID=74358 RepID=A0AA35LMX8_9SAUR|nr:USE1-like protein [Podarcis lilfordi]